LLAFNFNAYYRKLAFTPHAVGIVQEVEQVKWGKL